MERYVVQLLLEFEIDRGNGEMDVSPREIFHYRINFNLSNDTFHQSYFDRHTPANWYNERPW
jgi:hypothetical protein